MHNHDSGHENHHDNHSKCCHSHSCHHEHTHEVKGSEHHDHDCCGHNHETECVCGHTHYKKSSRDIVECAFALIIFILSFFARTSIAGIPVLKIISIALCGYKIFYRGMVSICKFKFDESTLMAIASVSSLFMQEFNEAFLIVLLFGIGDFLEEYVVEKSNKQIENLIDNTSDTAFDENGNKIDASSVSKDDILLIPSGERACTDGVIIRGSTTFDTSNLTGETFPLEASEGDCLLSGYINTGNAILCKATSDYTNSTSAKIKEYVFNARKHKAKTEKFIRKFARVYTPAVISVAALIGVGLGLSGTVSTIEALRRALTFMIASCPCALVISIPLSYYAGIGTAGKHGILIKGSKHINTLAKADAIAFDKTGTLTEGKLEISEIVLLTDKTKDEILSYACALEANSNHPIARAICNASPVTGFKAENVREFHGKGIEGTVNSKRVTLGNNKINPNGKTTIEDGLILTIDGTAEAVIKLNDSIKPDAKEALAELAKAGITSTYILSGDNGLQVEKTGNALGITKCFGELLPNDKAQKIQELKKFHKSVIFAGDGVNDGPALACADFSTAMASGSSLALEAGDATLISKSLIAIAKSKKIAIHTVKTIYSNIVFSLGIKALVLVLATIGIAPIWLALFADVGVLLIAVGNSLSIIYKKF